MSNNTYNKIILQNEKNANKTVANVMLISFAFFTIIYILNLTGVFIIDHVVMSIAYFVSGVLLLLPKLLNKLIGTESRKLKYIYVTFASMFMLMITSVLTYHVVLLYIFPVVIAGFYFSPRVTRYSTVTAAVVTVAGQLIGYALGRPDDNFPDLRTLIVYSILPRLIILIALSILITLLTKRTSALLKEDSENYEQQVRYSQNMIYGFATLVENRDENTGGHIRRTSIYAALLAEKLREKGLYCDIINDEFIKSLSLVAPLHDIGKISIPDNILCKPGKLTDEEFEIMKSHSAKGAEIIKETFSGISDDNYRSMAYDVARYHHEKWNGRGYPEGLSGEDIPLVARIMTVADVFDAVSEKRCYRDAMPIEQCFNIISEGVGRDFDPVVAQTFLELRDEVTHIRKTSDLNKK